jgi:hypothetical protein
MARCVGRFCRNRANPKRRDGRCDSCAAIHGKRYYWKKR